MRYAVFNGVHFEATPRAKGECPHCGSQLVARCGTRRVWHWAHKGRSHCDHWWENETEWHRDWKARFPKGFQEISSVDEHGERHIADVKIPGGQAVEFQRGLLDQQEIQKRSAFHRPLLWVLDGTRRKTDIKQFRQATCFQSSRFPQGDGTNVHRIGRYTMNLLFDWANVNADLAIDFGQSTVWVFCMFEGAWAYGYEYRKEQLVDDLINNCSLPDIVLTDRGPLRVGRRKTDVPF